MQLNKHTRLSSERSPQKANRFNKARKDQHGAGIQLDTHPKSAFRGWQQRILEEDVLEHVKPPQRDNDEVFWQDDDLCSVRRREQLNLSRSERKLHQQDTIQAEAADDSIIDVWKDIPSAVLTDGHSVILSPPQSQRSIDSSVDLPSDKETNLNLGYVNDTASFASKDFSDDDQVPCFDMERNRVYAPSMKLNPNDLHPTEWTTVTPAKKFDHSMENVEMPQGLSNYTKKRIATAAKHKEAWADDEERTSIAKALKKFNALQAASNDSEIHRRARSVEKNQIRNAKKTHKVRSQSLVEKRSHKGKSTKKKVKQYIPSTLYGKISNNKVPQSPKRKGSTTVTNNKTPPVEPTLQKKGDHLETRLIPSLRPTLKRKAEPALSKSNFPGTTQGSSLGPVDGLPPKPSNSTLSQPSLDSDEESLDMHIQNYKKGHRFHTSDESENSAISESAFTEPMPTVTSFQTNNIIPKVPKSNCRKQKNRGRPEAVFEPNISVNTNNTLFPSANLQDTLRPSVTLEEDDMNTIASGTTTRPGLGIDEDTEQPPTCLRYKFHVPLSSATSQLLEEEFQQDNHTDNPLDTLSIIRAGAIELVTEMLRIDPKALIISWPNDTTFSVIRNIASIPQKPAEFSTFFHNFKPKQSTGTMYLRVKVHTSLSNPSKLEKALGMWAKSAAMKFELCDMQCESPVGIGYVLFTTQSSNLSTLLTHLMTTTGYEWGSRLTALSQRDKDEEWKNRVKIMQLLVPCEYEESAAYEVNLAMDKVYSLKLYPSFTARYKFLYPESEMANRASKVNHQIFCNWHKTHCNKIRYKASHIIDGDIDFKYPMKNQQYLSIRQVVLSIPCRNKESPFHKDFLFHDVEFSEDLSKVWLGNRLGPKSSGFLFSFYDDNEAEALRMIKGLGVYTEATFGHHVRTTSSSGSNCITEMFTEEHWRSIGRWTWDSDKGIFETPLDSDMINNFAQDKDKPFALFAAIEAEAAETLDIPDKVIPPVEPLTNSNELKSPNLVTSKAKQKEMQMIAQMRHQDIGLVDDDNGGKTAPKLVDHVDLLSDQSTTSSLTNGTNLSLRNDSIISTHSNNTEATPHSSNISLASLKDVNAAACLELVKDVESEAEMKQIIQSMMDHKLKQLIVSTGSRVDKVFQDVLKAKQQESTSPKPVTSPLLANANIVSSTVTPRRSPRIQSSSHYSAGQES
jgi:hypothetical protein